MDAPRVVILSHTAEVGGGETALLRLIDAIDPGRFDLRVVTFEDGDLLSRLGDRGIPTETIALGSLNSATRNEAGTIASVGGAGQALSFIPQLARAVHRQQPDLLVANTLKAALAVSAVSPLVGTPWAWHLHDRLSSDYLPARTAAILRTVAQRLPKRVVVNSSSTLRTLGGIKRGRASIAYPGLEDAAFTGAASNAGVVSRGTIGILGRISETKGQREFAHAASEVLVAHPDARFTVIGSALFRDGEYETQVREFVSASDLGERFDFAGWAADPGAALRGLTLLVHASPVAEPFGQVIVEAIAAGVPVIAANGGGVPEIIDPEGEAADIADGVSRAAFGLLVRPGDSHALAVAMNWALDHPREMDAAAALALQSARTRFSITKTRDVVERAWTESLPRRTIRRMA